MKALSLFSGCLGFDFGMELADIETIAYVERDKHCQQTIQANRPSLPVFDDVFSPDLFRFVKKEKPELIFGGPPCQPFSTIGKRRFFEDERGCAMRGFFDIVKIGRPSYFILENVPGLVSAANGEVLAFIQNMFETYKYHTAWRIVNAVEVGSPQARKRFIMLGSRKKSKILPTVLSLLPSLPSPSTLREAIEDLENETGECLTFPPSIHRVMQKIPEGGCWKSLSRSEQKKAMGKANLSSGGLTAFYRRLWYDKPSPTLTTSPTQRATTLCHPVQDRPLSVQEYKRIQGFPDEWRVEGPLREKYKQLGNAVPIPLAYALGKIIQQIK